MAYNIKGGLAVAGTSYFSPVTLGDFATGGSIGSAATTVDLAAYIAIGQTTASQTLLLPSPTATSAGLMLTVSNTGSVSFVIDGVAAMSAGTTINVGVSAQFVWMGAAWSLAGDAAEGTALSGITAAISTHSIDSLNFAQAWNWNTLSTETAFTIASSSMTTGSLLRVENTSAASTNSTLYVLSAGTAAAPSGLANFNFSGSHTGPGFVINDNTATGTISSIDGASLTSGSALTIDAGSLGLTSGSGILLSSTATSGTGALLSVASSSTAAVTNGLSRFNFLGAHTGNGLQVDDATVAGTAVKVNTPALTTGTALAIDAGGSLVGGHGLSVISGSSLATSSLLYVSSVTTDLVGTGIVDFSLGNHASGAGLYVADATQAGSAVSIVANALTSGSALLVSGSGTSGIFASFSATGTNTGTILSVNGPGLASGSALVVTGTSDTGHLASITGSALTTGSALYVHGANAAATGATLLVESAGNATKPVLSLKNSIDTVSSYVTNATPESAITASIGDIATDATNGQLYVKRTGTATNTGWQAVGGSYNATFLVAAWTGGTTMTITAATHGRGTVPASIQVFSGSAAPYSMCGVDDISVAANGDVTLTITSGQAFDGRVVIA